MATETKIGDIKRGYELGKTRNPYGRYIWQACSECGKERWVNMNTLKHHSGLCGSCSQKRVPHPGHPHSMETRFRISQSHLKRNAGGRKSLLWKGGRGHNKKSGYIWVYIAPDNFFFPMARKGRGCGGRVQEHRLIMAKHLNRCLLPWEIVHHKNGNRQDNRIENLELIKGQKNHLPSIHAKQEFNRLIKRIEILETRITQLEAENILLKHGELIHGHRDK